MSTPATQVLAELIREKRRVLSQLHLVGKRQGELVALGDVAALLKLLAAKQKLLAGLQALEARLEPYRNEDPEQRNWPTPQHRTACAADADECRRLLAEIMEMERAHEQQMMQRRDGVAEQLQRVHVAHGANDAYQAHRRPTKPAPLVSGESPSSGIDLTSDV